MMHAELNEKSGCGQMNKERLAFSAGVSIIIEEICEGIKKSFERMERESDASWRSCFNSQKIVKRSKAETRLRMNEKISRT